MAPRQGEIALGLPGRSSMAGHGRKGRISEVVTKKKRSDDRSLIPMAQEHRKPIFNLTSADGAIGSHANAVQDAKKDFQRLAEKIAKKINLVL